MKEIPIQITSGTNDSIVPLSTAELLYKNANKPKKLIADQLNIQILHKLVTYSKARYNIQILYLVCYNIIKGADHFFYPVAWFMRWL